MLADICRPVKKQKKNLREIKKKKQDSVNVG